MNTPEGRAWRALAAVRGIGPRALWRIAGYLSDRGRTASWLIENPGGLADALGVGKASFVIPDLAARKYDGTDKFPGREVTLLHPLHADFPARLGRLTEAVALPALLYVRGNIAILERPGVAIVGRRRADAAALAAAASLAGELAARKVNVVSGYAAGIDSAAHAAALSGGGTTTVVLAEGIHHFQTKPELQGHLTVDNILVVSQFDPDARWAAYMAMARNKLVAALAHALVVIFSGPERDANGRNSGSFDAGMSALKMGIPAFAASPSFFSEAPPGNRELIQKGCSAWDPAAGAAPIITAVDSSAAKKAPRQPSLFAVRER